MPNHTIMEQINYQVNQMNQTSQMNQTNQTIPVIDQSFGESNARVISYPSLDARVISYPSLEAVKNYTNALSVIDLELYFEQTEKRVNNLITDSARLDADLEKTKREITKMQRFLYNQERKNTGRAIKNVGLVTSSLNIVV